MLAKQALGGLDTTRYFEYETRLSAPELLPSDKGGVKGLGF